MVASEQKTPWNPSRKATARVKTPAAIPEICRYCGGSVVIKKNSVIYGVAYGDWPWIYRCSGCRAYVGMHPFTNIPLGTLADSRLRKARKDCKPAFDNIWKYRHKTRTEAYSWLAEQLGISLDECHFGLFEVEMCKKAAAICELHYPSRKKR